MMKSKGRACWVRIQVASAPSPTQRIYRFAACLIAGLACMLLSMIVFAKPIKFALLFTFGNVLAVGSLSSWTCTTTQNDV
ncbi:uncharacterized protein LOC130936637 isoform X3 [Arachis stenosperma]|uniref:uncharacterized protein LOC130936637 isoform X3 n=1 Tax=Arachis stenosperma TaxID=217475 RepID=UPI0025AC1166|nr:uncharacterized protein LOC130936637 isoform X3 [Arachis stenosperma]